MKYLKSILSFIVVFTMFTGNLAFADVAKPVTWSFESKKIKKDIWELSFTATIEEGWHLYGTNIPEGGPIATSFNFPENLGIELIGEPTSTTSPDVKYDETFEMELELFDGEVTFKQQFKLLQSNANITGFIEFMACDDERCLPPSEENFEFLVEGKTTGSAGGQMNKGLLATFFIALLAGLGALLTPCVYPMIPLTVSFFMRGSSSKGKSISQAMVFGISIVLIYTLIGVLVAIFKNPNAVNSISTHWLLNSIFFVLFIILAVSFFGAFEIVLPSSLANKVDQKADKGGFVGAFFMALGMTILSFSCTGPIVASLLIKASQGEVIEPVIGMFGFGLAFAFPFTLLAIFPGAMNKLPKSGGWMNSIKVFFAFILLAFSLMFLSNVGLDFLTRDIVLALEIVIFILLGFYLLGKIKFSHDSELPFVSVPRIIFAILSFTVAVYMIPGLFGSPLKAISPFLPEAETSEMYGIRQSAITGTVAASNGTEHIASSSIDYSKICDNSPKYSDELHLPQNLAGYFDYEEGLACAKELNKPVLLDFVGHTCKNCKKMYADVWSDPAVKAKLSEDFVIIALYTDDKTKLPENEWVTSTIDGRVKKTLGKKNLDFQITKFNSNALPMYAILDTDGNVITSEEYYTYSSDPQKFLSFLNDGTSNFPREEELPQFLFQ